MRRAGLLALVLVTAACSPNTGIPERTEPSATAPPGLEARAPEVIDGDSLRLDVDGERAEVRLLGINAPEHDECWADRARAALEDAVADRDLTLVPAGEDQYGRLLARLYDGATDVGLSLVDGGHAIAIASEHDRLAEYLVAEDEAARLGRGRWAADACGPPIADHGVGIWAMQPDAPGRDDADPNGEWIAVANQGDDAVDLTGWAIRDESSVHRFVFPEGFGLAPGDIVTIRSGCGPDGALELHWCADTPVWTNSGDTALLLAPSGAIADRERYFGG